VLAAEIPQDVRNLTVHDITHIDALWETAEIIMGEAVSLTPTEAFVLGGAFLIHDLGLGLAAYPSGLSYLRARPEWSDLLLGALRSELGRDPIATELANPSAQVLDDVKFQLLRKLHAEQADRLAQVSWSAARSGDQFHLLEDTELRRELGPLIGRVAHSHWWPTAELPGRFPQAKMGTPVAFPQEWTIDALKLALVLRLADAAHLDGRRAPAFLRAVRRPTGQSDQHWEFQEKLYQVQREGDRLVYTSQSFSRTEAQSWWLCYETLQTVDAELRRADNLNADLGRERFAVNGVRGIEDPTRLAASIPTDGWLPVDARVRVGHVAALVGKLGGHELYGDDQSVPLRELIQNATDAVRARRVLQAKDEHWGRVFVRTGSDEYGPWLEIEDNGVGMSTEVLSGPFLDFGASYWSTPDAIAQFPGLLAGGFQSTGRYGIGFFSVFMWTDRVRVTTRRFEEAVRDTRVLEFEKGLKMRPLIRPAASTECLEDGGTRVRVWPRGVQDIDSPWISTSSSQWPSLRGYALAGDPISIARWLCLAIDVDLIGQAGSGEPVCLVKASDWLNIPGQMLLDRIKYRPSSLMIERLAASRERPTSIAASNLRHLTHNGRIVGRASIDTARFADPTPRGSLVVGGFRTNTLASIAGVVLGESTRASRQGARALVSADEVARWATEQRTLLVEANLPGNTQATCALLIAALGGNTEGLALGACPRNADFGGRTATLRVARISDSASDADAGFGHLAQSAFSEANLTENHAPDRRANATVAY
jgi:hypothetical protein